MSCQNICSSYNSWNFKLLHHIRHTKTTLATLLPIFLWICYHTVLLQMPSECSNPSRIQDIIFHWRFGVCAALCECPCQCSMGTSWMRLFQHVAIQLPCGRPWLPTIFLQPDKLWSKLQICITRQCAHRLGCSAYGRAFSEMSQAYRLLVTWVQQKIKMRIQYWYFELWWCLQAPLVGRLSDRFGRKPFLTLVLLVSTLAPVMLACHETFGMTLYAYFPAQVRYPLTKSH